MEKEPLSKGSSNEKVSWDTANRNFKNNALWRRVNTLLNVVEVRATPFTIAELLEIDEGLALNILEGLITLGLAERSGDHYVRPAEPSEIPLTNLNSLEELESHLNLTDQILSRVQRTKDARFAAGTVLMERSRANILIREFAQKLREESDRPVSVNDGKSLIEFTLTATEILKWEKGAPK